MRSAPTASPRQLPSGLARNSGRGAPGRAPPRPVTTPRAAARPSESPAGTRLGANSTPRLRPRSQGSRVRGGPGPSSRPDPSTPPRPPARDPRIHFHAGRRARAAPWPELLGSEMGAAPALPFLGATVSDTSRTSEPLASSPMSQPRRQNAEEVLHRGGRASQLGRGKRRDHSKPPPSRTPPPQFWLDGCAREPTPQLPFSPSSSPRFPRPLLPLLPPPPVAPPRPAPALRPCALRHGVTPTGPAAGASGTRSFACSRSLGAGASLAARGWPGARPPCRTVLWLSLPPAGLCRGGVAGVSPARLFVSSTVSPPWTGGGWRGGGPSRAPGTGRCGTRGPSLTLGISHDSILSFVFSRFTCLTDSLRESGARMSAARSCRSQFFTVSHTFEITLI